MATEFTVSESIARLLTKILLEFAVGSIVLFIWALFFDVGIQLTGSLATIMFGAPWVLLVAAIVTLYLPFSIIVGLLSGIFGRAGPPERQLNAWYAGACIGYICIGLFVTEGKFGSIAIGVSLIVGNVAYILLCLNRFRQP